MRQAFHVLCLALWLCVALYLAGVAHAVELDKIERKIGKLPEFNSKEQRYCLLVFGPEARKRVWLVHDGPVLFVDRNGNGDLTEPGERIEADEKSSDPKLEEFYFKAGDIPDKSGVHKGLSVGWNSLDHLRDQFPELDRTLAENPRFRGCNVYIEVAMPGQQGSGLGGRVPHSAGSWDDQGLLQFAARPADAPIVHFGGPWRISFFGSPDPLRIGRKEEIILSVGTPGLGAGATAHVAYEKVVPPTISPQLQITYPAAADGRPRIVETYELHERCCGVNLYGDIVVPEKAGVGVAQAVVSLESWPGAFVASSTHDVQVVPRPAPLKLESVSPRLVGKLEHSGPGTIISGINYSPDGKRLMAGTYDQGIINVWDVASGRRITSIDAGEGGRARTDYFLPSPDWKKVYAWQEPHGNYTTIERDGKRLMQVEYSATIRAWDTESGSLLRTYQTKPANGIRSINLSPDGQHILSLDETPGEFESSRPRALTLWNTESGTYRQVQVGNCVPECFSSDSRLAAIDMEPNDDEPLSASIKLFAAPDWKPVRTIVDKVDQCDARTFALGDRVLVGSVGQMKSKKDFLSVTEELKVWDVATGREVLSIASPEGTQRLGYMIASPDGQFVAANAYNNFAEKEARESFLLVDIARGTWQAVDVPPGARAGKAVFHPSGKWLAVESQIYPPGDDWEADEVPQPRIQLISVPEGKVLETVVAPQCFINSIAFSPDGSTMATSGLGAVLLWDFHREPGLPAPQGN
ncbi:MAG TPA: hypothetical protein VHD36_02025 [Pirellulales bacterium]|nr:hypothetical protein [Pirellulales bacterium]